MASGHTVLLVLVIFTNQIVFVLVSACQKQNDCPENLTCVAGKCKDLCPDISCGQNSACKTIDHTANCECFPGYVRVDLKVIELGCKKKEKRELSVKLRTEWVRVPSMKETSFSLTTHDHGVEIKRFVCVGEAKGDYEFTVGIEREDHTRPTNYRTLRVKTRKDSQFFSIPISTSDRRILLHPKTKYNVTISCNTAFYVYLSDTSVVKEKHFTLDLPKDGTDYLNPVTYIFYNLCPSNLTSDYEKAPLQYAEANSRFSNFDNKTISFLLKTRNFDLEIKELKCLSQSKGNYSYTVTIDQIVNTTETKVASVTYQVKTAEDRMFVYIPISLPYKRVSLSPNSEYNVKVSCDRTFGAYIHNVQNINTEDMIFQLSKVGNDYLSPVDHISYVQLPKIIK